MSEFQREHRYYVFKTKNLTEDQKQRLYDLQMELGPWNDVPECVVVESDWPNYQDTWSDIQAVSEGRFAPRAELQAERDALAAQVEVLKPLARRCLWGAVNWNDHNFDSLHKYCRKSAAEAGVFTVDQANALLESTPAECLNQIKAEAGRAGFMAALVADIQPCGESEAADQYAERIRQGGAA
jgi:hypothetical protein